MKAYMTKQRRLLLDFIKERADRQFTAEDIVNELGAAGGISVSAVYRNLAKLAEDGALRKLQHEDGRTAAYQYWRGPECHLHLHMKCTACGCLFHMDGEVSEGIAEKILRQDGFTLDGAKTILYGKCGDCLVEDKL